MEMRDDKKCLAFSGVIVLLVLVDRARQASKQLRFLLKVFILVSDISLVTHRVCIAVFEMCEDASYEEGHPRPRSQS